MRKGSNRKKQATPSSIKAARRRYFVQPGRTHDLPFSDAVLAANTLYLSGHLGLDPKTGRIPDSIELEICFLLESFKGTLAAARMKLDDLVYVQVFCPEVSLFSQFNAIYRTYFGKHFPTRAFLGSGPLLFDAHFELQGIAVKS